MTADPEFPNLCSFAAELGDRTEDLTAAELRRLLCHDCDFYTEDHEEDLECSCYQILKAIVRRGVLTPAQLADAVGKPGQGSPEEKK